ncbi:MAG TPA: F0F1 ATP synthase subunit alpha, partial [Rhodanobacteraceae bacterium]|nr:F0F1 ATP synthase subunit alpha [Rhodanobacteraceae bacterium]
MATTLNPSEISELIKNRIEKVKLGAESRNEGTIVSVSDGIVRIHGLADAMAGEMIELPGNAFALALNLERDSVGAVVLGDYEHLREGDTVKTTSR